MADCIYEKGREGFADGSIDWDSHTIKVVAVDLNDYALLISNASNASPIVITTTTTHGLATGDKVTISGVTGNTAANNTTSNKTWTVTFVNTTSFSLDSSVGNGTGSSGYAVKISVDDNLNDVPAGARIATSAALSGKDVTNGVLNAENAEFSAVSGDDITALIIYKDTGTESTSRLIAFIDSFTPITPNTADISVAWSDGVYKILRL